MALTNATKTTATPAVEQLYVAWQGFVSQEGEFVQGAKARGDHPAVIAHPSLFVPSDLPESEWPSVFDHALAQLDAEEAARQAERKAEISRQARANRRKLEAVVPKLLRATADFETTHEGVPALITRGSTVLEGSELALSHPEHFQPAK